MMPGPFEIISRVQRSGRNALAMYLLGLCITTGGGFMLGLLAGQESDNPIDLLLPGWLVFLWYALLLVGAIVSFVGICIPEVVTSLICERAGLTALMPAAAVYGVFVIMQGHSYVSGVTVEVFALSCLWRGLQIRAELRHIRTGR